MSLQNKKMQLFSQDNTSDQSADVDDIFAQYGGDEDDDTSLQGATPVSQKKNVDENEKNPIENVIANMNDGVTVEKPDPKDDGEKQWEKELEQKETPTPIKKIKQNVEEFAETSPQKTVEKNAVAPPIEKNDPSPISTKEPEEFIDTKLTAPIEEPKKVLEEKIDEHLPQKKDALEPITSVEKKTDDVQEEPINDSVESKKEAIFAVPPVKANYNSVMRAAPEKQVKKSYAEKDQGIDDDTHFDPSKKTIAVVDDDIDTLEMYADVFENADYNVIRAHDGLDALNVISDHVPHLIFTGIVMPRMDGFAMMESLKQNERTADIPVVINSHLGRDADRKRAEELGAKDFIVRGFTPPREALERIGALLMRNEYTFHFDQNDSDAKKLASDIGAGNFFVCPRGQKMAIKMSVIDSQDLTFSARFCCIDEKKKK